MQRRRQPLIVVAAATIAIPWGQDTGTLIPKSICIAEHMLAKFRPLMATTPMTKAAPAVVFSMAAERDGYAQYNHPDACQHLRWTARESYEYAELVRTGAGAAGLDDLFRKGKVFLPQKDHARYTNREEPLTSSEKQMSVKSSKGRGGRWERANFKIVLSYHVGVV